VTQFGRALLALKRNLTLHYDRMMLLARSAPHADHDQHLAHARGDVPWSPRARGRSLKSGKIAFWQITIVWLCRAARRCPVLCCTFQIAR
jgi:hypothetical protein